MKERLYLTNQPTAEDEANSQECSARLLPAAQLWEAGQPRAARP
jgi:hypothetical protein